MFMRLVFCFKTFIDLKHLFYSKHYRQNHFPVWKQKFCIFRMKKKSEKFSKRLQEKFIQEIEKIKENKNAKINS